MTIEQQQRITRLRANGVSFSKIADMTGIPASTVKSFCARRSDHTQCPTVAPRGTTCNHCGRELLSSGGHRKREYCSDACRLKHWRAEKREEGNAHANR